MKKKLLKTVVTIIVCIILNLAGRFLTTQLDLPLWLDTIGTFVATYLTGLVGGIIAAVVNTLIFVIADGAIPAYLIVSVGCAVVVKLFMKKGCLDSFSRAAVLSFWLGIICVINVHSDKLYLLRRLFRKYMGRCAFRYAHLERLP